MWLNYKSRKCFNSAASRLAERRSRISHTLIKDILAIGPLSGGSMNPARSFGPAVASGYFEAQLIYWAAPIVGGIVAAVLYDYLFIRRDVEPVDHGVLTPAATERERPKK